MVRHSFNKHAKAALWCAFAVFFLNGCKSGKDGTKHRHDVFSMEHKPAGRHLDEIWGTGALHWADSCLATMSRRERIGQLMMVAAYSNQTEKQYIELDSLIIKYKPGGLIFFQGGPYRQLQLTKRYQKHARIPLFIAIDGEWGLSMRLDTTGYLPKQMTLGALRDESLLFEYGGILARQCKRMGMQIDFAPVADINSNPLNPVIGYRSLGESRDDVARKATLIMNGMQQSGVLACAKHFPGHGDTKTDSHYELPLLDHGRERFDTLELVPFKTMIKNGLKSMMVAHLSIPAYDTSANTGASLSAPVIRGLLKNNLKFEGLVFTDALNMKGVSEHFKSGALEVKALEAGNDVLLFPENVPLAVDAIEQALREGRLNEDSVDHSVRKILMAKYWSGLHRAMVPATANLSSDILNPADEALSRRMFREAFTLLSNKDRLIPLVPKQNQRVAVVHMDPPKWQEFGQAVAGYEKHDAYVYRDTYPDERLHVLFDSLYAYDYLIFNFSNISRKPEKNFGFTKRMDDFVAAFPDHQRHVVCFMGNPYALRGTKTLHQSEAVLVGYESNPYTSRYAADVVFGGLSCNGRLPVSVDSVFKRGHGEEIPAATRMRVALPLELNIRDSLLNEVDSIALRAIRAEAMPGCRIIAVRGNVKFYDKSFGSFDYRGKQAVTPETVYDLASLTKVLSTTLAAMVLVDEGKLNPDQRVSDYFPKAAKSPCGELSIRDLLSHRSGLPPYIRFYLQAIRSKKAEKKWLRARENKRYSIRINEKLFLRNDFRDTILQTILSLTPDTSLHYQYSDLNFILLKEILEKASGKTLEQILQPVYADLGVSPVFNPLAKGIDTLMIPPTGLDTLFRKSIVRGTVHDETAAMLGGVAGHAGLFGTAEDVATIFALFMNEGRYNGKQIVSSATINLFLERPYPTINRRALGFDKPLSDRSKTQPCGTLCSDASFGHAGFTGTFAWADPATGLIYVFLSNRTWPHSSNKKLADLNVRTSIQDILNAAVVN